MKQKTELFVILLAFVVLSAPLAAQAVKRDKAMYKKRVLLPREQKEIIARDKARAKMKGVPYKPKKRKLGKKLTMDFSKIHRPHSPADFKQLWHNPPIRQWWTGTCWCFSTTSFMESEVYRLTGQKVKLSEMYTVYWEYLEKANEFIKTRGKTQFGEGSESNALTRSFRKHGIVRESDYNGLVNGATFFDHKALIEEIHSYLAYIKKHGYWDRDKALGYVKLILNHYMGVPPTKILVNEKEITPIEYMKNVLKLNPDDYVEFMSFLYVPFWTKGEYKVPDNYWHSKDYYNIPLNDWYEALKTSVQKGFTVVIGGDVSEPGYEGMEDIAVVPTFDIPGNYIDQSSREFRFYNHTSTDDHGIHIVGYTKIGDHDWYLIKDSSRSGQRGVPGYYFYRDDYVKLKMLTFMVHKDAVKNILAKFKDN